MKHADITFVILTKDESANIVECLQSLPDESPALVYDAMSADDTAPRARQLGATVVQAPWAGYVQARTAAASLVKTPWTFMLDADERLTTALWQELDALEPPSNLIAYSVSRRNWFCGRPIRCAGWWPDRLVRLFRTGTAHVRARATNEGAAIHETWHASGESGELAQPLEHHSYESVTQYRRKFARYTDLEAQGPRASLLTIIGSWLVAPLRFCWLMIGRGGLLEGWRGAYVCAGSALYPAVVATKSRRTRANESKSGPEGPLLH